MGHAQRPRRLLAGEDYRMRTPSRPESDSADTAPAKTERASRRSFMFFGALAAASLLPKTARAQARSRQRPVAEPVEEEFPTIRQNERAAAFAEWDSGIGRLVRRASYGATAAEIAKANQLGFQGYINYQLN